jgi:signal transduction histidine kinase
MLRIKQRHDDLQSALQLRQDLSNMIVHDIRSPVSTILIYCDLLEHQMGSDMDQVQAIRGEAQRLSSFLTDMLMMARMEHGRLMLARKKVDMNKLATAVYESYRPMADLKQIDFQMQLPESSPAIAVDENLWRRVMDNLVSNAVKFSPTKGQITLRLEDAENAGSSMRLQVIDQGPGIPVEHRDTIFDKFKIVASGRRDVKQVGLGLAFCKMVVDAHKGKIYMEPNAPKGSVFIVEM